MTDILDLPGWSVLDKRLVDNEYELEVTYETQPNTCQKCGVIGRLYKHGRKSVTYRDSPVRGRPVRLLVNVQRIKCRECGGTFQQPLGGMEPGRLMTGRCAEYIAEQCLRDTFTNIALHLGVNETTVRNVAAEYVQKLDGPSSEATERGVIPISEPERVLLDVRHHVSLERAVAFKRSRLTCFSCKGAFEPAELELHNLQPIVRGERRTGGVLLCRPCRVRFHIGEGSHDSPFKTNSQKTGLMLR